MPVLAGNPSDDVPSILAEGRSGVTTIYMSMSARHPHAQDAEYLRWHSFDCRPEQHRLPQLRASLRLVSTPACRAARARSEGIYDSVDHVMTYFFADPAGLPSFAKLTEALRSAGRKPYMDGRDGSEEMRLLPQLQTGLYRLDGMAAAPRIKVGADVLPWWPLRGAYLLVERGQSPARDLTQVPGVGGAWWGPTFEPDAEFSARANQMAAADLVTDELHVTYCFLDDDPVAVSEYLRPVLEKRWADIGLVPLLAAPFYPVVGCDFDRHLP